MHAQERDVHRIEAFSDIVISLDLRAGLPDVVESSSHFSQFQTAQVFARVTTLHDGLVAGRLYFGALGACALVLLTIAAGDRLEELPVMGMAVPVAWCAGVLLARRMPVAGVDLDAPAV